MKYTIHWNSFENPRMRNAKVVGVEIQPPVEDIALHGIISMLLPQQSETQPSTRQNHVAEAVVVTRNDQEGTALVADPNQLMAPVTIPLTIGRLLDPCGVHTIEYAPPMTGGITLGSMMPPAPTR